MRSETVGDDMELAPIAISSAAANSSADAYRRDVPKAEVHVLDAGHFALDTAADEIAALVRGFVDSSR